MYPSLDASNQGNINFQLNFKKQVPPSEAMTNAILEVTKNFSIASFKPHLNYHECYLSLPVSQKLSLPLKIILLRTFPKEKPLVYVTKWMKHSNISPTTCQVAYDVVFKWQEQSRLVDLIRKLQEQFGRSPPEDMSEIDKANQCLDRYLAQLQSLRNKPQGTQPPPPPQVNLQYVLKAFEQQDQLYNQCEQKNQLYISIAHEYKQNFSRVKCISERFNKGKILKQLQNQLEKQVAEVEGGKIEDKLKRYYESRKQYHRIKILKELYLEN